MWSELLQHGKGFIVEFCRRLRGADRRAFQAEVATDDVVRERPVKAADHDLHPEAKLVPLGILEVDSGQLFLSLGQSVETSDFIADGIEDWWLTRREAHRGVRKIVIDLDNGPNVQSRRTQFMKRLIEFADRHQLEFELVYYPPYHSKYNPVERC